MQQLFHSPQKFTSISPKSPTERAARVWDEREGEVIVQNGNLRKTIMGLVLVCIVLAGGLVVQSLKSTIIPYILEVDSASGMVKNMGPIQETQYTPKDAEIKYFLGQFIVNSREIPLDPVVYKQHWNTAYAFLTKNAAAKMSAEIQAENTSEQFGKKTVQVNIVSMLPMEGGNSYQVRWNEEEFVIGSGDKKTIPMSGIFTIATVPVKDEETLKVNPLGIYFSDFNWTKDSTANSAKKNK